ncbi:dimethylsulfonioproprionate lyase family protein [Roseovarius aestuarii]|uniref:Cupin domain protein n=1 Tax=Roseovarius aestuarii TaxID=475083 RepID=A0A1X7BMW3_9RHOB|nr:dimethylsulfonioproprionate lyase family protein [Roseovarius aestuarii]SMC10619.1 Cupin domain protein [Roseovarius aestuarii]
MTRAVWDTLLDAARETHQDHAQLSEFCPFPEDITAQPVAPFDIPAAELFTNEPCFGDTPYSTFFSALREAAPYAHWRETYKGTNIGQDFMDRFGCYCVIGPEAPFISETMRAWMVYMPPNLHYTWHHHPAEEMYMVIAGSARFFRQDETPEVLSAGQVSQHQSNQPHAMETEGGAVLAYVIWRNQFDVPPVLTSDKELS